MLQASEKPTLPMSTAEQVATGQIPADPERDFVCKLCVDKALEGLVFILEKQYYCPIHGPIEQTVKRVVNEMTPKFRGRYEQEVIHRMSKNNALGTVTDIVTAAASLGIEPKKLKELSYDMYYAASGCARLPTKEMKLAASLALVWMFVDFDCDARRKECGIFPTNDPNNKDIITGWSIWTGYPFHDRIATDFSIKTTGGIDFYFGEPHVLDDDEKEMHGILTREIVCPKCRGEKTITFYDKKEKQEVTKKCWVCYGDGMQKPERILAVQASLYVVSVAKKAQEAGIPYTPIRRVATVSLDNDTAWKSGTPFEKAFKRARVACLRAYCQIRARGGVPIVYGETDLSDEKGVVVFDPEAGLEARTTVIENPPQEELNKEKV